MIHEIIFYIDLLLLHLHLHLSLLLDLLSKVSFNFNDYITEFTRNSIKFDWLSCCCCCCVRGQSIANLEAVHTLYAFPTQHSIIIERKMMSKRMIEMIRIDLWIISKIGKCLLLFEVMNVSKSNILNLSAFYIVFFFVARPNRKNLPMPSVAISKKFFCH